MIITNYDYSYGYYDYGPLLKPPGREPLRLWRLKEPRQGGGGCKGVCSGERLRPPTKVGQVGILRILAVPVGRRYKIWDASSEAFRISGGHRKRNLAASQHDRRWTWNLTKQSSGPVQPKGETKAGRTGVRGRSRTFPRKETESVICPVTVLDIK